MSEDSALEAIPYNVDLIAWIAREHLGSEPDSGLATVRWLDGFIHHQHERGDTAKHSGLVQTLDFVRTVPGGNICGQRRAHAERGLRQA